MKVQTSAIDVMRIVGLFALGQWFRVKKGSVILVPTAFVQDLPERFYRSACIENCCSFTDRDTGNIISLDLDEIKAFTVEPAFKGELPNPKS